MKILVLNSGSSSIKFKLFEMDSKTAILDGFIEEIGSDHSKIKINLGREVFEKETPVKDHLEGMEILNSFFKKSGVLKDFSQLDGIGHRVVHGGNKFQDSTLIDENVIKTIDELSALAPLHNPGHLAGIKSAIAEAPNVPNVAVFDTVFHQTMPQYAYMYAIPYEYYEKYDVRKYGFHGTSHKYVAEQAANFMGIRLDAFNAISLHIGNGASVAAIKGGKSIDTSMGISPLEGLIMGTRSGDIDPAALSYIARITGKDPQELDYMLNKDSGLLGICGVSDIRKVKRMILDQNNKKAKLAYNMYMYRITKYIGSYFAIMGRVDAIIFTAGVGENYAHLRADICKTINHFGVNIDDDLNELKSNSIRFITKRDSVIRALVVPTNEELAIALEVRKLIKNKNFI